MKSELYRFVGGHFYFNNNVIKIRYDLINSPDIALYSADDLFDCYYDIMKIKSNERVNSITPFDSVRGHRFCYFLSDKD